MPVPPQFRINRGFIFESNDKDSRSKGFTLVELLIVVAIVAILSVIGVTVYTGIQKNARNSAKKADIDAIAKAYEVKYDSSGNYIALTDTDFASGKIPTPDGTTNTSYFVAGPNVLGGSNKNYILCASLIDNNQCFSNSSTCICKASSQGDPMEDFLSEGNLIPNGNFETDLSGWMSSNPTSFTMTQSTDAYAGSKSLRISSVAAPYHAIIRITPEIATVANADYVVSAWVKANDTLGNKGIVFVVYGPGFDNSPGLTAIPANGTWTKVSLSVNTSYTTLGVYFGNYDPYDRPVDLLIDGLKFEKI